MTIAASTPDIATESDNRAAARDHFAVTVTVGEPLQPGTPDYLSRGLAAPLSIWSAFYKRMFDIAGASIGLAIFALPMLLFALAIKLDDGGPALYSQRRLGGKRREFYILKFRTMICNAEPDGPAFAVEDDPRCTRLGRWLRWLNFDELPQLLNVLKGDMSLVGPRPERPEMLARIQRDIPAFPERLKVPAGITGLAQVHGLRGQTCFRKRLEYDLYYLHHWSPLLDLRIVLATIACGFRPPGTR